jgi:hypothetical protein
VVLMALGTVLMPLGTATARTIVTEVTGRQVYLATLDPGTVTYPGPNMHIRDSLLLFETQNSDPRLRGLNYITQNANFRPVPGGGWTGPLWGTWHEENSGGIWDGAWQAYRYEDGTTINHIVGHGSGGYAGLHMQLESVNGVSQGRIVETGP